MKTLRLLALLLVAVGTELTNATISASSPVTTTAAKPDVMDITKRPPHGTTAYYELTVRDLFKNNRWEQGKHLLDTALVKYPEMSAFHELIGRYYVHTASSVVTSRDSSAARPFYDKARYHLIRAVNIDEKNMNARQFMVQVETATKHYSSAIVYINELLEENPYNENLWRKKIDLYRRVGNNIEADRLLERLMAIYPRDEQLRKDLAYRKELLAKKQREHGDRIGQEQSLRQLIELEPNRSEHYMALTNLLYNTGRMSEAAEVAARGSATPGGIGLIEKRAGILCEMHRYQEAVQYIKQMQKAHPSARLQTLLQYLQMEAARASQLNDPYTAYAKVYATNHSREALDFLVSTSIQRNYLDDALLYLQDLRKSTGETPTLLYKEYLVNKRMGNKLKANNILEHLYQVQPDNEDVANEIALIRMEKAAEYIVEQQYYEAIPLLEFVCGTGAEAEVLEAAHQRLFNCYLQTRQYAKAEKELEVISARYPQEHGVVQKASLYNAWGRQKEALNMLAEQYYALPDTMARQREGLAASYEEIAVPYIKQMIAAGMVKRADVQLAEAVDICRESNDILQFRITTAQMLGQTENLRECIQRGRTLFPDNPYYIIKEAGLHSSEKEYAEALDILRPLFDVYLADSLLVNAYAENSELLALDYLKHKKLERAMEVVDSAMLYCPDNMSLIYTKALVYEQMKDFPQAYQWFKLYKASLDELSGHKYHLETLLHRMYRNSLSFEYQQARLGKEDAITGNAYLSYTRTTPRNEYSLGLSYAGRDGRTDKVEGNETELTKGGIGLQLGAGWKHRFSPRFAGKVEAAVSNSYFPVVTATLSGEYELPRDWTLTGRANYRMLNSFHGVYGWRSEFKGYNERGEALYGDPEYVRTSWVKSRKSMAQLGLGFLKPLGHFALQAGVDAFLIEWHDFYYNTNMKMQFFPVEGRNSHFYAVCGAGTAPESSLIDRSMPVGFHDVNAFVGMGGYYFVNSRISLGLSGTWYTMLSQSERLETSFIVNDPIVRTDYKNYFYIHASVGISF